MKAQSIANHVRVHPLYHYFAVPVSLALVLAAIGVLFIEFSLSNVVLLFSVVLLHLAIFLARDYAKKNQDRIIRAELRLRYYQLTQLPLEKTEEVLSTSQLVALRFASDDEFLRMINDPDTKKQSPREIKRQIIEWKADWMRV